MKATSKIIAATVLAIAFGATAIPASADYGDYGQHVYTQQNQSRFAPEGISSQAVKPAASKRSFANAERQRLFDAIDASHKAY
ncbi:MAG: hypothetical protein NWT00_02000 [Beijerinckiaceae bacterium]|jgi:hypothetical protein|nr:hypothetical protein [Beijerinckiaceae bacterium]